MHKVYFIIERKGDDYIYVSNSLTSSLEEANKDCDALNYEATDIRENDKGINVYFVSEDHMKYYKDIMKDAVKIWEDAKSERKDYNSEYGDDVF